MPLLLETLFLFLQQPIDLFDKLHQPLWVLLISGHSAQLFPVFAFFALHSGSRGPLIVEFIFRAYLLKFLTAFLVQLANEVLSKLQRTFL